MKKYISCLLMVVSSMLTTYAGNDLKVTASNGSPGDEVTVTVSLSSTDNIVAGEIHIPLDEQLEYVENSFTKNAGRLNGHEMTNSVGENNSLNVYFYSLDNLSLPKTDGVLFSFKVKLGKEPKSYSISPTVTLSGSSMNTLTTTVSGTSVKILAPKLEFASNTVSYGSVAIRSDYTRTLTVKNTGTTQLNVTNVSFSSDVLKSSESVFSIAAGGSKNLTISYSPIDRAAFSETATFTSNAINGTQSATITASPYSVNTLSVTGGSGTSGSEVTAKISMSNMEPITGVQCSFSLPTALDYVDYSFIPSERSNLLTSYASVQNRVLTIYLYSMDNNPIAEGSGTIGTFKVLLNGQSGTYYLTPSNVVLSNVDMENMVSSTSSGNVSILSPTISCNSSLSMGSSSLTETASKTFAIKNSGKAPLIINRVNFLAEGYSISETLPITIAAGATKNITVNYTGTQAGNYSTTMNIYSNDPTTSMKSVTVSGTLFEPNYLSVASVLSPDKKSCKVSFNLDNYSDIVAVQFNVHGLTGMTTSSSNLKVTDRCSGLSSSVTKIGDSDYQVFLFSFGNTPITGNEGEIFSLTFNSEEPVDKENLNVTVDNILLSNSKSVNMSSSTSVSCKTASLGDINGDGKLTIADLVALVSHLNGATPSKFINAAADVNGDNKISKDDVTSLSAVILDKKK